MIKPLYLFIDGVLIQSYPKKGGIQGSLFFCKSKCEIKLVLL
jgi:hypothetical protein